MIISWQGKDYDWDELAPTYTVAMWVANLEYAQVKGMKGWEDGVNVGDPRCLQGLYWVLMEQNGGQRVPLKTVDFGGGGAAAFYVALVQAAGREAAALIAAEVASAEAEGAEYKEPDPTLPAGPG